MKKRTLTLDNFDEEEFNRRLTEKLSKEPHLKQISGETWYFNPLIGVKKIIRDKSGNKINEIGD